MTAPQREPKHLLIIFARNPELGKVKQRLAAKLGDEKALHVYERLLSYTWQITHQLPVEKEIHWSDGVPLGSCWEADYKQLLQQGDDLGERIELAFERAFARGMQRVIIIGSDCRELTQEHLEEAFELLGKHGAVVGPAEDGGYYLLGLRRMYQGIFRMMPWGTDQIAKRTLETLHSQEVDVTLLPKLSDIDRPDDLEPWRDEFGL